MSALTKLRDGAAGVAAALESAASALAEIRVEIIGKEAEVDTLLSRPVALAEAIQTLDFGLAREAEIGRVAVAQIARKLAGRHDHAGFDASPIDGRERGLQIFLAGNLLREALLAELRKAYGKDTGITDDDREAEFDRLQIELLKLEQVEEMLIRESQRLGLPVQRRAAQHPDVILAPAEALAE